MRVIVYRLLSILLIIVSVGVFLSLSAVGGGYLGGFLIGGCAALAGLTGSCLYRRAKQHAVRARMLRVRQDPRSPVLYLRVFAGDREMAQFSISEKSSTLPLPIQLVTEEERLARAFDRIGPFTALGAPGEYLPTLGAERRYAKNDEWKDRIRELVHGARLVVIRAATSESLIWEMRLVKELVPPDKVVLLMPGDAEAYAQFSAVWIKEFGIALPPFHRQDNKSIQAMHTGIILFGPEWAPQFVPLSSRAFLRSTGYAPYFYALYPIYDRLGLPRPKPPLNWAIVILLGIVAFFLVFLPIALWIERMCLLTLPFSCANAGCD